MRRIELWALAVLWCMLAPSQGDGNIGCLYSQSVCTKGEEFCYDDYAFGRCIAVPSADPNVLYRYNMSSSDLQSFEMQLQRLLHLGYRWEHVYTQCVLQAMLYSSQIHAPIDMTVCEPFSDANILRAVDEKRSDLEVSEPEVDPQVAFVSFTPNTKSDFAHEVYVPPNDEDSLEELVYQSALQGNIKKHPEGNLYDENLNEEDKVRGIIKLANLEKNQLNYPEIDSDVPYDSDEDDELFYEPYRNLDPEGLQDDYYQSEYKVKKSLVDHENLQRPQFDKLNRESDDFDPFYQSTAEYLTENRFTPDEYEAISNTLQRYKQNFQSQNYPLDFDEFQNEIPEPRIYVDEDVPEIYHEAGSGEFDPNNLHFNDLNTRDDGVVERRKEELPKNVMNLLHYWKERTATSRHPLPPHGLHTGAVYGEGGLLYAPAMIDKKPSLSEEQLRFINDYDWGFKRRERLDVKKPGPRLDLPSSHVDKKNGTGQDSPNTPLELNVEHDHNQYPVDYDITHVTFKDHIETWSEGRQVIRTIAELLDLPPETFVEPHVGVKEVSFRVLQNAQGLTATDVAIKIGGIRKKLQEKCEVVVTASGVGNLSKRSFPLVQEAPSVWFADQTELLLVLGASATVVLAAGAALAVSMARDRNARRKLAGLAAASQHDAEATHDYEDLCRSRMSGKWQTQQPAGAGGVAGVGAGAEAAVAARIASLSRDSDGNSPSTRSSTSSWSEEPALTNMDISTGHMVLAYMEDHLKNKDRLEQEWQALCAYEAEPCAQIAALAPDNSNKNRYQHILPYDHSRVTLNTLTNHAGSDYINASTISDHDPRNPAYIAAQGPLADTAPDFWQMVWEQGSVVMVMLTRLTENSVNMCHRYWPEEGSQLYHVYEVHLVSEHIWCDDYLVRSFYLKNQKTGETRTVTQFHFLSWPHHSVPASTKALLEFRRKVNKSYRGRSCPIVVHCSDGASRTGTYCLIDMVLNRMAKGAKEIDIAATLEHIRDQRAATVATKQQFEFVLMAVAEEVHAILKALPAQLQQQHEKRDKELAEKDK